MTNLRSFSHLIGKAATGPLSPGDTYVAPELTTISVGFMMDSMENSVSMQMAPSVRVDKQTGKYANFPRNYFLRDEMIKRPDGAESPIGTMAMGFDSYAADVWSWKTLQGAQAAANMRPLDLDQVATMLCSNKAVLKREVLWHNAFFKTGKWTTDLQGATSPTGTQFLTFNDATAKPIKILKDAIRNQAKLTGGLYRANRAVFSYDAWDAFCEHPNVISRVNAGQMPGAPAEITTQMVAAWLRLDKVIVTESVKTTSAEGATDSFGFIADQGQILLAYVNPAPALFKPSAMYSFDWVPDGVVGGFGNAVAKWWEQSRKATAYEIEMATDQHLVAADLGTMLYGCLT